MNVGAIEKKACANAIIFSFRHASLVVVIIMCRFDKKKEVPTEIIKENTTFGNIDESDLRHKTETKTSTQYEPHATVTA